MRLPHLLLALVVVAIWGVNFAIIKLGLREVSPLALGVWRFALAVFPWIFFVKRPEAPVRLIVLYGLLIFAMQFGFMFTGMKVGMSAGLSSLVLQLQVFFTIGLSVLLLGERPAFWQLAGAVLAFAGVGVVAMHVGGDVTLAGLALLVAAAASWGGGNVVSKLISQQAAAVSMLGLVVWGSLVALPPLTIVALIVDREAFLQSFTGLDWVSLGSIAYIVYLSTLFGFAAWSTLLGRYPVSTVAPFTLLVPVFGFLGSAVLLGEPLQGWKLAASGLVVAGLGLNLFGPRLFNSRGR
ncbi:EamA family transporter [Mesorhizobium sp. YM1C-6-2]|uniref:EamA family transporter n=1 Tax=Mesorhizobium sp. YM1C-6-2 TaxID=1827501 RepID=UPI000EF19EF3|nr:EamA family transporter [Mesorhizobium sp. YM1C-6-2]RLP27679.1 O-acetylserine/cysteine exporter [Mesorhizobium sp. YM1C-6-2]